MNDMLLGGIAIASVSIGLFFFRFWKSTRDRFFLYFAIAFWIEGVNRIIFGLTGAVRETTPLYYLIRLLSYSLILLAILEKNYRRKKMP
jgi:hypothetical protein